MHFQASGYLPALRDLIHRTISHLERPMQQEMTIENPERELANVWDEVYRLFFRATMGDKTARNFSTLTGFCRMASTLPG